MISFWMLSYRFHAQVTKSADWFPVWHVLSSLKMKENTSDGNMLLLRFCCFLYTTKPSCLEWKPRRHPILLPFLHHPSHIDAGALSAILPGMARSPVLFLSGWHHPTSILTLSLLHFIFPYSNCSGAQILLSYSFEEHFIIIQICLAHVLVSQLCVNYTLSLKFLLDSVCTLHLKRCCSLCNDLLLTAIWHSTTVSPSTFSSEISTLQNISSSHFF